MCRPTLSLCMIVKDCESHVVEALRSVDDQVDEIVVVDTGSSDRTREVIRESFPRAVLLDFNERTHRESFVLDVEDTWRRFSIPGPYTGKYHLADFAAARQHGWDHATSDYVFWIDSDDIVKGADRLRDVVGNMEKDGIKTALFDYHYDHDEQGRVTCEHIRERIVRRSKQIRWYEPVHEVLSYATPFRHYREVVIVHRRRELHPPPIWHHRNIKILYRAWEKIKDLPRPEPRTLFYLGAEERFLHPARALKHLERYVVLSRWDEERAVAHLLMAVIHESEARIQDAFAHYSQAAAEFPWNPDAMLGLGRCAYFRNDWEKCVEFTRRGIEILENPDKQERVATLMHNPLGRAVIPYLFLARSLAELNRAEEALAACKLGLESRPHDPLIKNIVRLYQEFLDCRRKESSMPQDVQDDSLRVSMHFDPAEPLDMRPANLPSKVMLAMAMEMWKQLMASRFEARALAFLDALPASIALHEIVSRARRLTLESLPLSEHGMTLLPEEKRRLPEELAQEERGERAPESAARPSATEAESIAPTVIPARKKPHSVVIWTGPAWEPWTPSSITQGGIGGSETAAALMARELCKLGHQVTVIGHCPGGKQFDDPVTEGSKVRYVHHDHVDGVNCDVLVVSRQAHLLAVPSFRAKKRYLWVHDIHVGDDCPEVRQALGNADRILCLSRWHRQFFLDTYKGLDPKQVIVTRNGISTALYRQTAPEKQGSRLVYSSSPDRGLPLLLQLFPRIKDEVQDASLDIFYGFDNWEKMARAHQDERSLALIDHIKGELERLRSADVRWHGRVGQTTLAEAQLASKVWAYPTWFSETSCITAMEVQAAGCVPVSSHIAALPETVSHGFLLKGYGTEAYLESFVKRVVHLLKDEPERARFAEAGRSFALARHDWSSVAAEWNTMFSQDLGQGQ